MKTRNKRKEVPEQYIYKFLDDCLRSKNIDFFSTDMSDKELKANGIAGRSIAEYINTKLWGIDKEYSIVTRSVRNYIKKFEERWREEGHTGELIKRTKIGKFYKYTYSDKNWKNTLLRDALGNSLTPTTIDQLLQLLDDAQLILPQYRVLRAYLEALKSSTPMSDESSFSNVLESLKSRDLIVFEENPNLLGMEHFEDLMHYVLNQNVISLTFQGYDKPEMKVTVHCYQLRQWRGRWFLVGYAPKFGNLGIYAIDRIISYTLLQEKFLGPDAEELADIQNPDLDPNNYFEYLVGVTRNRDCELEEITIRVNGRKQYHYIKTKPIVPDDDGTWSEEKVAADGTPYYIYTLQTYDNYEFRSVLLSYGSSVEVLSPEHLRQELAEEVEKMQTRYKKNKLNKATEQ